MGKREILDELQGRIDAMGSGASRHAENRTASKGGSGQAPLSDSGGALKKIIALVNVSDRSERAIRERLARDGFSEADADGAVEQAKLYGFIDDRRFSEVLVRSRISQGKGSAGIVRELAENGIQAEDVPGWPYEYPLSHEEELDRALGVLGRKPPHAKNQRDAAYRRLMQKGYPSSVASSAARIWTEMNSM